MNNYKYFKCFDGPSESWFCWMFLLFLFKSKTRQRKSLGLPLTNYNINPHQCVSELFCIFRCGSISCQSLTADSHTTDYTHSNTCIRQGSGLVINVVYKDKTKPKTETFDTPITIIEWSECLSGACWPYWWLNRTFYCCFSEE